MQLKSAVIVAALAGTTLATPEIAAVEVVVRSVTTLSKVQPNAVEKRDLAECTSVAAQIISKIDLKSLPTPPPKLQTDLASYYSAHTDVDTCSPHFTGSLSSEFAQYTSSFSSWFNKNKGAYSSIYSACSDVPEIASSISAVVGSCTAQANGGSSDTAASATATGSSPAKGAVSGSGSSASATGSGAAASASGAAASGSASASGAAASASASAKPSGSAADALVGSSLSGLAAIAGVVAYLL